MTEGKVPFACVIAASLFLAGGDVSGQNASPEDLLYDSSGASVIITGFKQRDAKGDLRIPDFLNGKPVTSIGDPSNRFWNEGAFYECENLTGITIPDGVISIGPYTFLRCTSLESVTLPNSINYIGDHSFIECKSLKSITIPERVTSIENTTFDNCISLTSVTIPDGLTSIGSGAFRMCTSLKSVTIPDSVTSIGSQAFYDCDSLETVIFRGNAPTLGGGSFEGVSPDAKIYVTSSATGFGSTFGGLRISQGGLDDLLWKVVGEEVHITGCNSGASGTLDIPAIIEGKPVTSIGDEAIAFCRVLENVTIPNSVTTIGADAFYDCDSLKSINVHPDNSSYSSLYGALYNKEKTTLRVVPEGFTGLLVLPESVNNISNNAFNSCRRISEILFKPLQAPAIEVADEDPFWALLPRYNGVFQAAYILPNAQGYDAIGYESLTRVTLGQTKEDKTPPALKLLGSAMMTLNDGETYMEAGVMVENAYDQAYGYELVTEGSINNAVPGDYTLTYIATDEADNEARITRTIRVVDTPPSLTLIGSGMLNHEAGQPYEEQGATAVDMIDGSVEVTISGKVDENTKPGTYILTYTAKDSVGNVATITRNVEVVDTVRPTITLLHRPDHRASSSIDLFERTLGDFKDPGAEAFDTVDGTIEFSSISIIGDVDTTKLGKYELTYTAKDKAGNVASVTRNVHVVDRTPPTLRLIGDEVIEIEVGKDYTDSGAGVVWDASDGSGTVIVRTGGAVGNQVVNSDGNPVSQVNTNIDFKDNVGRDRTFGTAVVYKALAVGSYTIEYGASDELSNVVSVSRKIIVTPDVTPPVINVIGPAWNVITVDDIDEWFYDKLYNGEWAEGATAYDAVEGVVKVSTPYEHYLPVNPISERNFEPWHRDVQRRGLYVLTYKATDKSGNSAVAYRKIQVIDEGEIPYTEEELITADFEPPVITLNGPEHVNLYAGDPYEEQGAKAEDAQDGAVVVDTGGGNFNTNSLGNYEVNYYAQDRFGNRSRATRYVHVIDPNARLLEFKITGDSVRVVDCDESISGDLIIPSSWEGKPVTSIGYAAMGYCKYLTSVTIPDSVTIIGTDAFAYCFSLTSVTIPDSVTSIGTYAFGACGLKSVTIGNGVTSIGTYAFQNCHSLPSVTIPDSVISIGEGAFDDCPNLTSVTIGNGVISIGGRAFLKTGLKSVTLGKSVTFIGYAAFSLIDNLTNVTIPDGVTNIGESTFTHCKNLTSVTIGDSVTNFFTEAFFGCIRLTSITFEGNAPELLGNDLYDSTEDPRFRFNRNAKVYVKANATGFGTTFGGLPVCVDGTCSGGGGNTSDGPIVDAVVFFDANLNGVLDPGEPETTSNSWGDYLLDIPLVTYDLDNNGVIDINEGMIVSQGGTDTATGLPMKTTLKGPANATVITPLTTLVTRVMQQNPGLDAVAAADKVKASLEIPDGVDILSFDTFKEASEENPAAADVLTATAKLQDTLLQGGGVIRGGTGKSLQEGADAVLDAVARQVEAGDAVDLDSKGSLKNLLTEAATQSGANLTEAQTDGAASIMEASSKAKEDAKAAATTVTELATEVSRVQAVSQSKAAADLEAVGAGTANLGATVQAYTGSSFEQQVRTEVVGDFTGSSGEAPVFAFQSASYTVNEDGQQQPIIQINRTGDSIESVDLRVTPVGLSATAGEDFKGDPITVRFESLEIRKTLDLVALLLDDSLPEAEETLYLELSVVEGLEELEGL
ncbi:leucine-rich repeat protein, partial [Verrucomicrobia bacterium]|nr:leucine-rich repeat protein [Verrucomicrobiota bacterium]